MRVHALAICAEGFVCRNGFMRSDGRKEIQSVDQQSGFTWRVSFTCSFTSPHVLPFIREWWIKGIKVTHTHIFRILSNIYDGTFTKIVNKAFCSGVNLEIEGSVHQK